MSSKDKIENLKNGILSGIKPEVLITVEHDEMISTIAELWETAPTQARKLERAFIAICNNETHSF